MIKAYLHIRLKIFKPLNRKLLRDVWQMRGQVLAVAFVVASGVALNVMMNGVLTSLSDTREAYYNRYNMADVWAPVKRAPSTVLDRLSEMPGVKRLEGRITAIALLDVDGYSEAVRGQLISIPENRQSRINGVYLKRGSYPAPRSEEVIVSEDFLLAHNLNIGDFLEANLYGVKRRLKISGAALAPEFIYSIAPGEMIPNPARFAIMWMRYDALSNAFDMKGAFNEVVLKLDRNAPVDDMLRKIDALLDPYGGVGAYHRENQMSHKFLSNEFMQLDVMGGVLPPIFLCVAAFLLNMIVTRIVEQEREQIGLMKAFGYSSNAVVRHYLRLATIIVMIGIIMGWVLGTQMGGGIASLYMEFFKFPSLEFEPHFSVYVKSALIAIIAGASGVFFAVRKTAKLDPAVAMSPPVPTDYSGIGKIGRKAKWMDQGTRMIMRHLARWPGRAFLTCIGIGMGMGVMVGAQGGQDAMNLMIDTQFELISRQDVTVSFTDPQDRSVINELLALEGVITAEPFLAVPATLHAGHKKRHEGITGVLYDAELNILVSKNNKQIKPAPKGLTLSASLAEILQVELGREVIVEFKSGKRKQVSLPVQRIVSTYMGTPAYMEMNSLSAILQEGNRISGAFLLVDSHALSRLHHKLKSMPKVAAVDVTKTSMDAMQKTMDEAMGSMTFFNTLFASLIAIGVVFSSVRISFYERQRELASLRVLGFTVGEVNAVLLGELALLTFIALPVGGFLGWQLAEFMAVSMSSELFRISATISYWTYGYGVLVILIAAFLSAGLIARKVSKLDLVIALKSRE